MSDPIDRQAALDALAEWHDAAITNRLNNLPSVDAVRVIRCKDCKWYQPDADKWCGYFECMGFEPDDYCSQAKWKDGDSE